MILIYVILATLLYWLIHLLADVNGESQGSQLAGNVFVISLLLALILSIVIGFFIVRATWRAAKQPIESAG